jgi:hypothetical protein
VKDRGHKFAVIATSENRKMERLQRIQELIEQRQLVDAELKTLKEQASQELRAFRPPRKSRKAGRASVDP